MKKKFDFSLIPKNTSGILGCILLLSPLFITAASSRKLAMDSALRQSDSFCIQATVNSNCMEFNTIEIDMGVLETGGDDDLDSMSGDSQEKPKESNTIAVSETDSNVDIIMEMGLMSTNIAGFNT